MFPDIFVCAGEAYASYEKSVPAPIFRKSFIIDSLESQAELIVGATGFYDLFLNGEKITKGFLAPFISNPDDVIFYDRYDLTGRLKPGENVLGVMLGNGFCNPIGGAIWGHTERENRAPAFSLRFLCENTAFGAENMLWKRSHILFDDYRCGTLCDRRKEEPNWSFPGYIEKDWHSPIYAPTPRGEKRFVSCEPIKTARELAPIEIFPGALRDYRMRDAFANRLFCDESVMGKTPVCGGYIYDFGENNAGAVRLKIKGKKGQKIHMQFTELLFEGFADYINVDVYPDGCCQRDVYICRGDEEEIYIPPFTYHGFRYCYVYGITKEQATPELLTYLVLHNAVRTRADFRCSDEISNLIFDACRRSDESNLFYILTDCPQREKNGWTGDAAISAEHYCMNFGVENCFADWMRCICKAQSEHGELPLIVPSSNTPGQCCIWDSVLFFLPFYTYKYTGSELIIADNAEAMMRNLRAHYSSRDARGIVENGLGDWLPVDVPADYYASPLGFCCSAILIKMCQIGEILFGKINRENFAAECKEMSMALRNAVRKEYNDGGIITAGKTEKYRRAQYRTCQTSQVLGLYAGVFDACEKQKALQMLVQLIEERNNSFDCGFLGMRFIFHILAENGYAELAYHMITKPTHPSYGNMIYRGETTVWERFVKPGKRIGSHNHHFMADVSAWYLQRVLGIEVNPALDNPNCVRLNPMFIEALSFAEGSYEAPAGRVEVRWERTDDKMVVLYVKKAGDISIIYEPGLQKRCVIVEKN